jgi:hypothetical protein
MVGPASEDIQLNGKFQIKQPRRAKKPAMMLCLSVYNWILRACA